MRTVDLGLVIVAADVLAWPTQVLAGGQGVFIETVDTYTPCNGQDLTNANASGQNFNDVLLEPPNGAGFYLTGWYQDNNVWDTDFLDPDPPSSHGVGDDNYNFDQPGTGIAFYQGHGAELGGPITHQCCTSAATCSIPPTNLGVGTSGKGTCVQTPYSASLCGAGYGVCSYWDAPGLQLCSTTTGGNPSNTVPICNPPSPQPPAWDRMYLGENPIVGAWAGAGTNGGIGLAIVHMSWGLVPFFPMSNWRPLFAGLQLYAGVMPTWGDTWDIADFGSAVAAGYQSSGGTSQVVTDYVNSMSHITSGNDCVTGYPGGGFANCGCQVIVTFSGTSMGADAVFAESWMALTSNSTYQTNTGFWHWKASCNYNAITYPWNGGY